MKEYLLPELTPKFVYDNCATLKNKGIDFALNRFKKHFQNAHRKYGLGKDFYCLRVDIRKYFDSIDHEALKDIVKKIISDEQVVNLLCYFIDTFVFKITKDEEPIPGKQYYITKKGKYIKTRIKEFKPHHKYYEYSEKSLGLGSETSQLLALLTLNETDHFIKERLHIKYYGRYMDDLYLFHSDSKYLAYCQQEIERMVNKVGLQINLKKTTITKVHPLKHGEKKHNPVKYLKWDFYLTDTNHIIMTPFRKKINHQRRKLRKMHALWLENKISTKEVQQSYQGWRAHIKKGTTFYIIQDMDNYFKHLFKGVEIL